MKHLQNVLVGVDYSEPSDSALREAVRIARWDGARLVAIHVLDVEVVHDLGRSVELEEQAVTKLGRERLEKHVGKVLGADHGVCIEFVIGHPFKEMTRAAERFGADLIVLGSHGGESDDPSRVGVLASRCVRKAKQNVLLVRASQNRPFRKVVACIDFSETSRKAARQAIHIAQQDGAVLEFLHVCQPVSDMVVHPDFYTGALPAMSADFDKKLAEKLEGELEGFVHDLTAEAGDVAHEISIVQQFNPRQAIVKHLNETGADLVVIGTRGHTVLRNLLLGSTAEKIVHGAASSTLAVKPKGFEYSLD